MYGKGKTYNMFGGRDATRALSKMSFKPEDVNSHDTSDFGPAEEKTKLEWEAKFVSKKYPIVGIVV